MNDDDVLRRALHSPPEPFSSYQALEELRPSMRRARNRRRAAVGATATLILLGGGAGVLALTSAASPSSVRTTSTDDENGALISTLPPVTDPSERTDNETPEEPGAPTTAGAPVLVEPPAKTGADEEGREAPEAPPSTLAPGAAGVTPSFDELPSATPTTAASPEPVAPAAPPPPAEPKSQLLASTCGDVVVEFDERTVRITSIASLPGYTSQVSTDGPQSVEMKFLGADDTCEVHAELKANGLAVEIQHSDHDG